MKAKSALISVVVFLLSQAALAQITVPFVTGEWAPLVSDKLPNKGPAVELILAITKAAGITPVITFLPWARAEMTVQDGETFAAFPYAGTTERRSKFLISEPFLITHSKFIAYTGNPRTPAALANKSLEELKMSMIGAPSGGFVIDLLKSEGYKRVYVTEDTNRSIEILKSGKIDYFAEVPIVAFDSIKKLFPQDIDKFIIMNNTPFPKTEIGLIVSKSYPDSPEILKKFNNGLAIIKKSGEYKKIMNKYSQAAN